MKVSIVIPTYNERENIPILVERLAKALRDYDYEIIIVDDNSPDGTAEVARELSEKYPIRVFVREKKLGLGTAVLYGFSKAQGDVFVVMDADLQHPPEIIPKLLEKIKTADIAIASRYVKGGQAKGLSGMRKVISHGARFLSYLFIPRTLKVKDPMSGFFAVKKEVVENVKMRGIGYKILVEILAKGKWKKVAEVPFVFEPRKYGASKLSKKEITNYLKQLLFVSWDTKTIIIPVSICIGIIIAILLLLLW